MLFYVCNQYVYTKVCLSADNYADISTRMKYMYGDRHPYTVGAFALLVYLLI